MPLLIAAFDIATSTGGADGRSGDKPRAWTWNLDKAGKGRPQRLAYLRDYCDRYFTETRPDCVFYERGLGLAAAFEIGMSDDTMALLRGAIGVLEASAAKAKIPHIQPVGVQEARRYLLGPGRIPKGEGKALVRERCRVMGWPVANDDEADATCIWAYGCGQMSPAMAAMTTPLFSR